MIARRSYRSTLTALAAFAMNCQRVVDPPLPPGTLRFSPPAVYATWWSMVEACAGIQAPLDGVQWYVVPRHSLTLGGDSGLAGYWTFASNALVLGSDWQLSGPAVRHEMLHALVRSKAKGHARSMFVGKCGGVVACERSCLADAGAPASGDPMAVRVPADDLTVDVSITTAVPSSGVDSGFFALTVTARNPMTKPVVVVLRGRGLAGTDLPRTFGYFIRGPSLAVSNDVSASDSDAVRFAPGETKRQVFDFRVGLGGVAAGMRVGGTLEVPPGSYTATASYGLHTASATFAVQP